MNHHLPVCGVLAATLGAAAPLSAQLDPLLFLKATRPRVIIALDVSSRMQRDAQERYYDPLVFQRTGEAYEASLGIDASTVNNEYRRRYLDLAWWDGGLPARGSVRAIEVVGDRTPLFADFDGFTRLGRARSAVRRAIEANIRSVQFGLVTTRQAAPRIDTDTWSEVALGAADPTQPTDTGAAGQWRAGIPVVDGGGPALQLPADAVGTNAELVRLLARPPRADGALLPAGLDTARAVDAPLARLLDDVRTEAARLVAADTACCNTIAVLVAGGGDPSVGPDGLGEAAVPFLVVGGRRVPVYVVAIAPSPSEAGQLRQAAARSGGQYAEVTAEMMDRVPPTEPVPEITAAINAAVQHAFALPSDFNAAPSSAQPAGPPSFFPTAAPVVGTVNLEGAVDSAGQPLPETRITGPRGEPIPQRANVVLTAGFQLPGFAGRLSAFRVYRPVPDDRQVTGYRFVADGTRLWTAATPPADQRNLFTVVPGVGVVPFRAATAELLRPFLLADDPVLLVEAVRAQPLGPIVNSTPALLEPPSMPFVDAEYAQYAEAQRRRRSLLFVGADDGMLHALDARTGTEVWALVPFNLLPKLRLLREGRPVDDFRYLVDGSPRLADVKVLGAWRTLLFVGEGPGGTFYQAFDVTLDGIAERVAPDADDVAGLLAWFSDPRRIPFKWSYPRYEQFDPAIAPDGDLRAGATEAEKSVGETWSTPVVGRAGGPAGPFVVVVGSGRLPRSRERQTQRGGTRAGTRLYMLDAATGALLDSRDVGNDGVAEEQDDCRADSCRTLKNALQADPAGVVSRETGSITRAYVGDLDGRVWRFELASGPGPPGFAGGPRLLFETGADQPIFGSLALLTGGAGQVYLFLGTGSDLLPRNGTNGAFRFVGMADSAAGVSRQFERLLRTAARDGVDEGLAGTPVLGGSVAFFATNSRRPGTGCDPPEATVYAVTIAGGVAYDANGDGRRDASDTPVVARLRAGRASAPVVADRHVFVATGERLQVLGDPEQFGGFPAFLGIRIVSWREVR